MGEEFNGYIQIYTGNGKGKTTAALGLAVRAAGHRMRTYIGQFLKGQDYGELRAIKSLSDFITIEQFGRKGFYHVTPDPDEKDIQMAKDGLESCRRAMLSGNYDIVVLDEINVAMYFHLLDENEVLAVLDLKPKDVEIVLTGRYAPASFLEKADLVTEMKEIKHYYNSGITARKGIEK